MIRKLDASQEANQLSGELQYTIRRLKKDPRVQACKEFEPLVERLQELDKQVSVHPELSLAAINDIRCEVFGLLSWVACSNQLDPVWPRNFFKQGSNNTSIEPPSLDPQARVATFPGPQSWQDWLVIAQHRAEDARTLLSCSQGIGAVYMAGYAVGCSLKALMLRLGKPFPTSGSGGHDLRALWNASGFRMCDLGPDQKGAKTYFVDCWSTSLRYEQHLGSETLPAMELVNGAAQISGFLHTQVKRHRGRQYG